MIGILLRVNELQKTVIPLTVLLELGESSLRFGKVAPVDLTHRLDYSELERVIIDADDGHLRVTDHLGKTHLISGELSISKTDFSDIKQFLEQARRFR